MLERIHNLENIMMIKSRKMRWAGHVTCMGGGSGNMRETITLRT
jgi:hypothetical protein